MKIYLDFVSRSQSQSVVLWRWADRIISWREVLRIANLFDPVNRNRPGGQEPNEEIKIQGGEVAILRPRSPVSEPVCMEVDRERNRVRAADAIEAARAAAERGALSDAVSILEDCRRILSETFSSRSGDRLCMALDAELREMQERMANRQRYEASGRAYLLSGLSSHSWQRATARGDSTDSDTLVYSYQTPSMVHMLQRSQNHCPSPQGPSQPRVLVKPQPR